MINRFFRKYFSIIYVFAILMGVFHHHHDGKQHSDCQVCSIQSNLANADTPTDVVYLSQLDIAFESIVVKFANLHSKKTKNFLNARAPPYIS